MSFDSEINREIVVGNNECVGPRLFNGTLYHGFVFSDTLHNERVLDSSYDYTKLGLDKSAGALYDSMDIGENGMTLGHGLYTTDDRERGIHYLYNQPLKQSRAGRTELLKLELDDVRMYDFRDPRDMSKNGIVPKEVAEQWMNYFMAHQQELLDNIGEAPNPVWRVRMSDLVSYEFFLKNFLERYDDPSSLDVNNVPPGLADFSPRCNLLGVGDMKRDMSILDLLRSFGGDYVTAHHRYAGLWAKFVKDELGCAGIIANEVGFSENKSDEGSVPKPSYVLYDLSSISSQEIEEI